ncbi:MAG: ATP-binding cassette domain-containing protein, partial [Bacteroidota bacterium]
MKLVIDSLSKTYPNGIKALQKVSLEIAPGMFGLLGPNGAGKSTLMRTLATLQDVDEGSILLGDINLQTDKHAVRKVLGYLPQQFGLYPKMSAQELLNHFAILKGFTHTGQRRE